MSALPVLTTPRATSAYFNISSRALSRAPISPRDFNREMSKTYHPLKKKEKKKKSNPIEDPILERTNSRGKSQRLLLFPPLLPLPLSSVHRTPQDIFFPTIYFKREIRRAGGDPGSRGIDVYTVFPLEIKQKKKREKKKKKEKSHTRRKNNTYKLHSRQLSIGAAILADRSGAARRTPGNE